MTSKDSAAAAADIPALDALRRFVGAQRRLLILTGAGVSRASGIPTYRDHEGNWTSRTPILHKAFMESENIRQRYWTRSFIGWPNVAGARPNPAHRALASLEELGNADCLVTQNVDGLHQQAGHRNVIDLHGRLDRVVCMSCGIIIARAHVQEWLKQHNPHLHGHHPELAPDGDADATHELIALTRVPACENCGGILKPDVVFFGDWVQRKTAASVSESLSRADGLLVVGTSLMVFSGYRICRDAHAAGKPIACINRGTTRADHLLALKVQYDCTAMLQALTGNC